jgi:hypothetical protein
MIRRPQWRETGFQGTNRSDVRLAPPETPLCDVLVNRKGLMACKWNRSSPCSKVGALARFFAFTIACISTNAVSQISTGFVLVSSGYWPEFELFFARPECSGPRDRTAV